MSAMPASPAGRAPFLEAGPSFRAAGNLNGYNPSHFGVTAGGGAEIRKGAVLLSTALRYTRWAKDGIPDSLASIGTTESAQAGSAIILPARPVRDRSTRLQAPVPYHVTSSIPARCTLE